jgi:hypothetical protein
MLEGLKEMIFGRLLIILSKIKMIKELKYYKESFSDLEIEL